MVSKQKNYARSLFNLCIAFGVLIVVSQALASDLTQNISSPEDYFDKPSTPLSTPSPSHPPFSPSPSPSSSPSPSPTPDVCSYISGSLNDMGTRHGAYAGNIFEKYGDATKFRCIDQLISRVRSSAYNWRQFWNDDSYAVALAQIIFPDRNGRSQKTGVHSNGAICNRLYNGDVPRGRDFCGVGRFFMDANTCEIISVPSGMECARFALNYLKGCPVSLVWEDGAENSVTPQVVQFSLGNNPSDWTIWKGSEKTPLLVYDPQRTGKVASASQLFGEWTFGGKKTAALHSNDIHSDAITDSPKPWKDGYEALSVLDSDKNGKVDGKELEVVSLWFDKNQDAVSQNGEVIPATEAGVQALYYKNASKDEKGDLVLSRGFERFAGSESIVGKSIDWYSPVSSSPLDLVSAYQAGKSFSSEIVTESIDALDEESQASAVNGPSSFAGLWKWSVTSPQKDSEVFGGYLTFQKADDKGSIFGFTINERLLDVSPHKDVKTGGSIFSVDGFESNVGGRKKIVFNSEYEGNSLQSRAFLSVDGKTLNGKTVAKAKDGAQLTYYWSAEKQVLE